MIIFSSSVLFIAVGKIIWLALDLFYMKNRKLVQNVWQGWQAKDQIFFCFPFFSFHLSAINCVDGLFCSPRITEAISYIGYSTCHCCNFSKCCLSTFANSVKLVALAPLARIFGFSAFHEIMQRVVNYLNQTSALLFICFHWFPDSKLIWQK